MRTAADFNQLYATPDPWRISRARFRDRALKRHLSSIVQGKRILELGCGEGHLTEAIFNNAASVVGVDISDVAVQRARARRLPNASFETRDFLQTSFESYDVITAIECLYYLSAQEQEQFFTKIRDEHRGVLILTAPITGETKFRKYFTHLELMTIFDRHHFSVDFANLTVMRRNIPTAIASILTRISPIFLDWIPTNLIYQRLYMIRISLFAMMVGCVLL